MTVPSYVDLMRPVLEEVAGCPEIYRVDLVERISAKLNLSPDEKAETIPSGQQTRIHSRVGWAKTYLKKAGLLESTRRGYIKITERGIQALKQNPSSINVKTLKQYPEFLTFLAGEKDYAEKVDSSVIEIDEAQTPIEALEKNYLQLVAVARQELLDRIITSPSDFFEQLILDLLVAMGYGGSQKDTSQRLGKTGDGGIDGVIKEDTLGLDVIYVQAKRYKESNSVPVAHVRDFAGSLQAARANKGVFVTTSSFTKDAYEFVAKLHSKIILIDGEALTKLLYEHNIGVRNEMSFHIKKIDEGYFSE